jgi:hypothetical protein
MRLRRWQKGSSQKVKVMVLKQLFGADSIRAFGSLAEKVADYEAVLKDISLRVGEEDANLIRALLEKVTVWSDSLTVFTL